MTSDSQMLAGRTIIVTRAVERAGGLTSLFVDAGAKVLEIPVTTTVDALDGGNALQTAIDTIEQYEWVVVTSPEGAHRLREAMALLDASPRQFKIAAVGTATAAALGGADLVPKVQTGRSLGEIFPSGSGRVLLAVAETAGTDFEVAASNKGWTIDRVTSYRTVSITPTDVRSVEISQADAITFASASSARAWHDVFGVIMPKVVVAMGPMTASALSELGIPDVVVATEQSLQGVVNATVEALASR
ncbi:MAG: uroporphyrinogen-III synthase [Actinomycetes bacterium]